MSTDGCERKRSGCKNVLLIMATIVWMAAVAIKNVTEFLLQKFNNLSFGEIIFHLKVPMRGAGESMIVEYFKFAGRELFLALLVSVILCIVVMQTKKLHGKWVTSGAMLVLALGFSGFVAYSAYRDLDVSSYLEMQAEKSVLIEENYINPNEVKITFPEKKRNLIYIYLESMESTWLSKDEGGHMETSLIPELGMLAEENINFAADDLIGGAVTPNGMGWTIAAMVAQTSGLPLLIPVEGNSYGEYSEFLPGVVSLGDILAEEGYRQEIMVGSDMAFAGRDLYFSQHGNYEIWDYYTAVEQGKIPEDYFVWWGFEDDKLYEYAKEEITEMAAGGQPFNVTLLTVDTHHIGGYVCDSCGSDYDASYKNVLQCASRQAYEFVCWIQEQDFYENTTIVISGDHLSMDNEFVNAYCDTSRPRYVYNCIINSAVTTENSKHRDFTTMDLFPTTLAALGCTIEGNRLGLGTNLFSDEKTLIEIYTFQEVNQEFGKYSDFYTKEFLWE